VKVFGPSLVEQQLTDVLAALTTGGFNASQLEGLHVDLKEEAGRRGPGGAIGPSVPRNDSAAKLLVEEAACMANTRHGGALIVGVANDGTLIGTDLEAEWLRHRLYELSGKELTTDVRVETINGARLVIVRSPEAVEPIRHKNKVKWRINDNCEEIDPSSWHEQRLQRFGYDWSVQNSGLTTGDVRPVALARARDFLNDSNETSAGELAAQRDIDLLKRLNVVIDEDSLTNAGALMFVGTGRPALDYRQRDYAGGDSIQRINDPNRALIEELYEVERAIRATNRIRHLPSGLVNSQVRELPVRAVREAIINGVAHRDWNSVAATVVERVGRNLEVVSPGGFVNGVTSDNIITHSSASRNPALAQLCADLRIAEREGIGVDRMFADMLTLGLPSPVIEETSGPYVRAVLVGADVDEQWMNLLRGLNPARAGKDLNSLLLLRHMTEHFWVDQRAAAPIIQRSETEAAHALGDLAATRFNGRPVLRQVRGVPEEEQPAWTISSHVLQWLGPKLNGQPRPRDSRAQVALAWARWRKRISTTELGSIVTASPTNVGHILKGAEAAGLLAAGRTNRTGAGFYYVPVEQ